MKSNNTASDDGVSDVELAEGFRNEPISGYVFVAAAGLFIIRLIIASRLELFQDEALYSWISEKAPWSFSPHPPGIPLISFLGISLFGKSELGLRFFSSLITSSAILPFWKLASSMLGTARAKWALMAFCCTPMYFAFGAIVTPDGVQLSLWCLTLWLTWLALNRNRPVYWIAIGAVVGLGLYFKYILILYFPSLFLCLLLHKPWRSYLKTAGPYITAAVAFVLFVPPAAYAEASQGWPALRYHLADRQAASSSPIVNIAVYHGVHAGQYSPLLYILAVAAIFWSGWRGRHTHSSALVFLFSFSVFVWLFFGVISAFTRRELSREQWDAMAYVPALIAFVFMVSNRGTIPENSLLGMRGRRTLIVTLGIGFFMLILVVVEALTTGVSGILRRKPLFSNMIGWRAMSAAVDEHSRQLAREGNVFLVGHSFSVALQYAFYQGNQVPVYTLDHRSNREYGLVSLLKRTKATQEDMIQERMGSNALYVFEDTPRKIRPIKPDPEREQKLRQFFDQVKELPHVDVLIDGPGDSRMGRRFRIYECRGFRAEPASKSMR